MAARHRGRPPGSGVVWPSAKTVYALRASEVLAAAYPDRLLKAADIARESKVPLRFLSKILGEMREAGLVTSRRGYHGGYVFARDPRTVTVADLALAISGYEVFAPVPDDRMQQAYPFVEHLQGRLREVASEVLRSTSVAEITPAPPAHPTPS
jgi:Rrf2 family protein